MTSNDPNSRPKHAADGELPPWWTALPCRRLAVALGSTFVAVPVVVLDNLPQQGPTRAEAVEVVAPSSAEEPTPTTAPPTSTTVTVTAPTTAPAPPTTEAPDTTTTTAPPATTTTTAAPAPQPAPPPPPPTTAPPPPPPPPPAPAPANAESGRATWYRYRDGECAHKTLPRGTVVTVTNTATGASATCVVTDRGPYGAGRIIDLDDGTFAQLAPLSSGVIHVTITW